MAFFFSGRSMVIVPMPSLAEYEMNPMGRPYGAPPAPADAEPAPEPAPNDEGPGAAAPGPSGPSSDGRHSHLPASHQIWFIWWRPENAMPTPFVPSGRTLLSR